MGHKDKPYRVYRGGREKGPIGQLREEGLAGSPPPQDGGKERIGGVTPVAVAVPPAAPPVSPPVVPQPVRRRRRGRRIALRVGLALLVVVLALAGWGAWGYMAFRSGVKDANRRLPDNGAAALSPQTGSLLSSPSNLLVLGIDSGAGGRTDQGRADAMILIHTDPDAHRIAFLTIPRDLRVELPGQGLIKINAAYALGGVPFAVRAVEDLVGQPVNHIAVVDLARFPEVIDALGGVTIDVAKPIQSNKFECPFASRAACERWRGWRFEKGPQTMNGRRALVYARIRENILDPSESDLTRGGRQQQVIQAIGDEVVSPTGFFRLPFVGDDLVSPVATDLSAAQLLELGWVRFRAADDATLRCRLGGDPATIDEVFYLIGGEENAAVAAMVFGDSAPQPPPPGQPFGAGCAVG